LIPKKGMWRQSTVGAVFSLCRPTRLSELRDSKRVHASGGAERLGVDELPDSA
jgi:hypothetical protein